MSGIQEDDTKPPDEDTPSYDEIDSMEPKEAVELALAKGITDFSDLFELKRKLKLEVTRERQQNGTSTGMRQSEFIRTIKRQLVEDAKRRRHLNEYLTQAIDLALKIKSLRVSNCTEDGTSSYIDDPLIAHINADIPNFLEKLVELQETSPSSAKCPILISGESGSGKSSFINLLLGEDILPTSIQSNTSSFVRIEYAEKRKAEFFNEDGELLARIQDCDDFVDKIKPHLEQKEHGHRKTMACHSAVLYSKSDILKEGLQIVDTLGFGEQDKFDEKLREYFDKACGFIYIMKKTNPIGDEKVGGLVTYVTHILKNLEQCHYGSVLFIINMWDDIQKQINDSEHKGRVFDFFFEKLKDCWKDLKEDQVIPLSTTDAQYMQFHGIISEDYARVLQAINRLWIYSLNNQTNRIFSGLRKFVTSALEAIISMFNQTRRESTVRTRAEKYAKTKAELAELRSRMNSFVKQKERLLDQRSQEGSRMLINYLKSSHVRNKIAIVVERDDIPVEGIMEITCINERIRLLVSEKIKGVFQELEEENKFFYTTQMGLIDNFMVQFKEFENTADQIAQMITSGELDLTKIDDSQKTSLSYWLDFEKMSTNEKIVLGVLVPILFPVVFVGALIALPVLGVWNLTAYWYRRFDSQSLRCYYENPRLYARDLACATIDAYVSSKKEIRACVFGRMKQSRDVLNLMKFKLKDHIDRLKKKIQLLKEETRESEVILTAYSLIKWKLEMLKDDLIRFDIFHLQRDRKDILYDEIEYEVNVDGSPITLCKGYNRTVYKGKINSDVLKDLSDFHVSILAFESYDWNNSVGDMVKEFCEYKRLRSTWMPFLRIHYFVKFSPNSELRAPLMVTEAVESSLADYLKMHFRNMELKISGQDPEYRKMECVKDIFEQVASGLSYLHARGLVHLDLSLHSIAVSVYHNVKLTSITVPRYVDINHATISTAYVLQNCRFAPEVLSDAPALYDSKAEIYSLGIALHEAWTGVIPFLHNIVNRDEPIETVKSFHDFILDGMRPTGKPFLDMKGDYSSIYAEQIHNIIQWCWDNDPQKRPKIDAFLEVIINPVRFLEIA